MGLYGLHSLWSLGGGLSLAREAYLRTWHYVPFDHKSTFFISMPGMQKVTHMLQLGYTLIFPKVLRENPRSHSPGKTVASILTE